MKIPTVEERVERLQHEIEQDVVISALEDRLKALERVLGLDAKE